MTLTALMLVAFAATGEAKRRAPRRHPSNDWKVTIATSGGFTGRGNGTVTVSSDGTIAVTQPARPNAPQQPGGGAAPPPQKTPLAYTNAAYQSIPLFWTGTGLLLAGVVLVAALPVRGRSRGRAPGVSEP